MGVDLNLILPVLAKLGGRDAEKAYLIYRQNKPLVDLAFKGLQSLLNRDRKEKKPPSAFVPPEIKVPAPPPVPVVGSPVAVAPGYEQVVSSISLKVWLENHGEIVDKPSRDRILSMEDPAPGDGHLKVHFDITPYDDKGVEIGPGDPDLAQMDNPDGSFKMQYHWEWRGGDIECITVHQYHRDHGCTPFLKIHEMPNQVDNILTFWASYEGRETQKYTIRVKR